MWGHRGSVHLLTTGQGCACTCVHIGEDSHAAKDAHESSPRQRQLREEWVPKVLVPLPGPHVPRPLPVVLLLLSWYHLLSP